MNLHSFTDGLVLGLLAMTGVFLILAVIGLILYVFELIFYHPLKHKEKPAVVAEEGIPKSVVAAITAAIYKYANYGNIGKIRTVKIKKHKKINKTYEKLKLERWRNG